MKKKWQLIGIGLATLIILGGCTNDEPIEVTETETVVENDTIANGQVNDSANNYGFGDASYENWAVEGVESHERILLDTYGEPDEIVEKTYQGIMAYLKDAKLTEDDYVTIFKLSETEETTNYFVIKNVLEEEKYFSKVYVIEGNVESARFDILNTTELDGQVNEAKVDLYTVKDHILITTEAPASAYIDNYYLKWNKGLMFLMRDSFDLMEGYLEKRIALLEKGAVEEALALEEVHLYPSTYENLMNKSNNLALKKLYPLAKDLSDQEKWAQAKSYIEADVWTYVDRAVVGADTFNAYIESEVDKDYGLDKKEVTEIFQLYYQLLEKTEDKENLEMFQVYMDELKA